MSQVPRWYRKQSLTKKLFTGDPWADGLLDQQDVINRKKAIEAELDRQDHEYQNSQQDEVSRYLRKLKGDN